MNTDSDFPYGPLESLKERAKELDCLYRVDEILADAARPLTEVGPAVVGALPAGWRHPEVCCARLSVLHCLCESANFAETPWRMMAPIVVEDEKIGELAVYYLEEKPLASEGPFLEEERRLINAIAERVGFFVTRRLLRKAHDHLQLVDESGAEPWDKVIGFLRSTDPHLLARITRRMLNHLVLTGVPDAEQLLHDYVKDVGPDRARYADDNVPQRKERLQDLAALGEATFTIAARELGEKAVVATIRSWIEEEGATFLIETLEDQSCGLSEIFEAIDRYRNTAGGAVSMPRPIRRTISAALIRRLFTDEKEFVNVAQDFVDLEDAYDLARHVIHPSRSHGKLGGKSAGLFFASQVTRRAAEHLDFAWQVKVPRTWYLSSDAQIEFLNYNNLRDLYSRKYMDIEQVRQEYPHIVQVFKNSHFPNQITRGLEVALDDLGNQPLIVRSSSLLEDRVGSSFAGKYKSLFLANRGSRSERQAALKDAVAEVYASVFAPDPIEYRAARGLLDEHEEMGIMIQEVVGRRVGEHFLPAFSGVAFSNNDVRWSARLRREDGLVRMVPGLGTRAVDRLGDDYPVLASPGQPGLRVNVTDQEVMRYAPRLLDVINLETNTLETVAAADFLRHCGHEYPAIRDLVSIVDEGRVRRPIGLEPDFERDDVIVTFEGLLGSTDFLQQMNSLLELLREKLHRPVDIEFASDGETLYLLQCRAQSQSEQFAPSPIPRNLPRESLLFTAHRDICNGRVPDITHIVFVDAMQYSALASKRDLLDVGRAVGRLNKMLPKRRFVLIGPGRWGSRGDIRLGVRVTYADISNTAVLIEVAKKTGNYVPEPSFGTHFFQDLVEADIRYIPLYPDDPENVLAEEFLRNAKNHLAELLPEFAHLEDTVRVVEVGKETGGCVLRIALNAEASEAVGYFDVPTKSDEHLRIAPPVVENEDSHSHWRMRMAKALAQAVDPARFATRSVYVFGSTKNGNARPDSDINLLVHDGGPGPTRAALELWLEGWSRSLAEINFLRTGCRRSELLSVVFLTDEDIAAQSSYAAKIGAATNSARELRLQSPRADG